MILLALAALGGCHSAEKAARYAAARDLADPASAQFRNIRANHEGVVCGEVNGKDRRGIETGFRKFTYYSHTGNSMLEPANVHAAFDKVDYLCRTASNTADAAKACSAAQSLAPAEQAHEHFMTRHAVDCR